MWTLRPFDAGTKNSAFNPLQRTKEGTERGQVFNTHQGFRHSQSHPCGPGTCVGSRGSGWPGYLRCLWFGWAGREEEEISEKKSDKKSASSKSVKPDKSVKSPSRPASSSSSTGQGKSTAPSTDSKLSDLDKKWSDRFNRLEALLMAKTLDRPQEPVFGTVKVTPSHAPPAGLIRPEPFIQPTTLPQPADTALASPATDPVPHGSTTTSKASSSGLPELAQPRQKRSATAFDISKKDASPSSDSESDSLSSDHPLVDIFPEEGELSDDYGGKYI